ncbi:hypothetical protein ABMA32_07540 [Mesorhizobium sp. VNQ89]|uniref:hypothetical protein n=1 Tax=Mesorhizobium quangtriensis TaxID=3157709 RepID=UPI0032B75AED
MASELDDGLNGEVEVFYHKSNFFRVVHADGCYGGITPRGAVNIAFYSERKAIPLRTKMKVVEGVTQPETVVESKPGFVRELEVDIFMDFNSSVSFFVWFKEKIDTLRKHSGVSDEDWKKMIGGA